MSIVETPAAVRTQPVQRFVLHNVSWEEYGKFLEAIGENHVRVTYDRGSIEFMSPQPIHEVYKMLFGRLFDVLMMELNVPMKALGSTTFRRPEADAGLEPDQCFYFSSAARVRSWWTFSLAVDPPPDLAIEVDNTSSSLDRMHVYAGLRIPEVWRFDGETLEVRRLRPDGVYEVLSQSVELPFLPMEEVPELLHRSMECQEDRALVRGLREWVRTRVAPLKQAWDENQGVAEEQ
jgi:Uma2 family endonuclease